MQGSSTIEQLPAGKDADRSALDRARKGLGQIILGKDEQIELALSCLLARGHLLIEDLPGLGKTMLAQSLARRTGIELSPHPSLRATCCPPILWVCPYSARNRGEFEFQAGPIFSQLILADEVNRATPKAQSALLEAMEEHQVSVDGHTRALPEPFFVVATQNPADQIGTFPLPESQLDRFLMRLELGYPNAENERELITGEDRRAMLKDVEAATSPEVLVALQKAASTSHMSDALVDYIQALVRQTRESPDIEIGLSPRGAQALAAAAKAHAFVRKHSGVFPDDVQAVFAARRGPSTEARWQRRIPQRRRTLPACRRLGGPFPSPKTLFPSVGAAASRRARKWARKRQGTDADATTLTARRTYILPTGVGPHLCVNDVRDAARLDELQQQPVICADVPADLDRLRCDAPVPAQSCRPRSQFCGCRAGVLHRNRQYSRLP